MTVGLISSFVTYQLRNYLSSQSLGGLGSTNGVSNRVL